MRLLKKHNDGFTLIELLVALGLLSILLYVVAYSFATTQRAFSTVNSSLEAHQEARTIMDMLARELGSAQMAQYYDQNEADETKRRKTGMFSAAETFADDTTRESGKTLKIHHQAFNFTTTAFQAAGAHAPQLVEVIYDHSAPKSQQPGPRANLDDVRLMRADERVLNKSIHWIDWGIYKNTNYDTANKPGLTTGPEGAGFSVLYFALRFYDQRALDASNNPDPKWTVDGNWPATKGYLPAAVEITLVVRPQNAKREFPLVRVVQIPQAN
jgi:prepilin-type N-terminal cleavage/methylation domain-containing protein